MCSHHPLRSIQANKLQFVHICKSLALTWTSQSEMSAKPSLMKLYAKRTRNASGHQPMASSSKRVDAQKVNSTRQDKPCLTKSTLPQPATKPASLTNTAWSLPSAESSMPTMANASSTKELVPNQLMEHLICIRRLKRRIQAKLLLFVRICRSLVLRRIRLE